MRLDLAHMAASTFNVPLLMHKRRLDTALSALGPRIVDGTVLRPGPDAAPLRTERVERHAAVGAARRRYAGGGYLTEAGIGVLPIVGTLLRRGTWLDAECGLMSYGLIRQGYDDMLADPSTRGVIVEYDTPGGEAGGCFDLALHMRAAAEAAGKPLWAHANELAASAGYALASAASRIWVATTGEVGSIGVVAAHVDMSKADEKAGLKWTYIYEGDRKVDGNPHEPLSDEADASIRADVGALYAMFVDLVARNRGISAQHVRETEADTFRGKIAVDRKLADEVGTLDEALEAFADHVDGSTAGGPLARRALSPARRAVVAAEVERVRANSNALLAAAEDLKAEGVEVDADLVSSAVARGIGPDAFRAEIASQRAAHGRTAWAKAFKRRPGR